MQIQTIFKAGNSNVVTIPTELMQQLNFQVGERVVVEKSPVGKGMLIKKSGQVKYTDELNQWFKVFIKENGEILDELAVR
ncbi:AbrB/MazE/SpoVT family DNA-binding domain-containing protein [Microgenomates group bacterium]|nr:AbrB/MazE/SpoVT family DNA-binding domain-containing protein [Microgenomates group bacterium]